jgi:hypothetical protein
MYDSSRLFLEKRSTSSRTQNDSRKKMKGCVLDSIREKRNDQHIEKVAHKSQREDRDTEETRDQEGSRHPLGGETATQLKK